MSSVLAVSSSMEAMLQLNFYYLIDGNVFGPIKLLLLDRTNLALVACLKQIFGSEKRPKMLGSERGISVEFCSHTDE